MIRRRLWLFLAAAALAVFVAACGGGGDDNEATPSQPTKNVTLTFWNGFTGPDRPALEEIVKRFNASHPKIKVQMTIMPWDSFFQKLLPSYGAGKGPDIAAMDSVQVPQYADKGVFAPLDDVYTDNVVPKDKLVQSAVEAGKWDDKYYSIPMNFTTLLLYWNKDMFKEAGLDPNKPPADWKQWQNAAVKLTKDENGDGKPEQYGYAIADHATIPMWPILIWGNGGDVVTKDGDVMLDDPKTVNAVEQWSNLIINKKISPIGLGGADADKLFQSKKAAMEVVGPWMTTGFKEAGIDFGLAMVPKGPAKQVTLGTSVQFVLNAKADDDKQAAAYEFFKYWHSQPSQQYWAVHSGFPPTRTDVGKAQLKENPYVAEFGEYADQSQFYLVGVKDFTKVNTNTFEPAIQRILNKKGTPEQVLGNAAKKIEAQTASN